MFTATTRGSGSAMLFSTATKTVILFPELLSRISYFLVSSVALFQWYRTFR